MYTRPRGTKLRDARRRIQYTSAMLCGKRHIVQYFCLIMDSDGVVVEDVWIMMLLFSVPRVHSRDCLISDVMWKETNCAMLWILICIMDSDGVVVQDVWIMMLWFSVPRVHSRDCLFLKRDNRDKQGPK